MPKLLLILLFLLSFPAQAVSLLESTTCGWLGCAVIRSEREESVYLLHQPAGMPAMQWWTAPVASSAVQSRELPVGIDTNGDGQGDIFVQDANSNGFLDAADHLNGFQLTRQTRFVIKGDVEHELFLSANKSFDLYSTARLARKTGALPVNLAQITHHPALRGNGRGLELRGGVAPVDVEDMARAPVKIAHFNAPPPQAARPEDQAVTLVNRYVFPAYDLSQGSGEIRLEIRYQVFN
jgi:hypothetical protein